MEHNEKLQNLFIAARNARETSDEQTAIKHYEEITALEPNSWEALFYLAVLKTNTIKYGEISNAAVGVGNCLPKVFQLINTTIQDEQEKKAAVQEVKKQCVDTAVWLLKTSGNYYNALTKKDPSFSLIGAAVNADGKRHARYESAQRMVNIGNILCICGNTIEATFGLEDAFYQNLAVDCWEGMLSVHTEHIKIYKVAVFNEETIQKYSGKIRQYKPSYQPEQVKATEKRDYTLKALLIVGGVLVASALWYWWVWF